MHLTAYKSINLVTIFITLQKFKISFVIMTLCNFESCISNQGLQSSTNLAELDINVFKRTAFCRDFAHH
ncbi:hypothetical protein BpHYR1_045811 [Brachionus plicatilis]|uniref:Uncharacterized protein n=1 Tax=Brachionus plicatilis TaxID=10195 RepID=A0A3M7SYR7_BRAPC|nr:hypothetical protein BpHYR1_045811 [Brachionus plicatilis]